MKTIIKPLCVRALLISATIFTYSCTEKENFYEENLEEFAVAEVTVSTSSALTFQAEDYDGMNGVKTESTSDTGGGTNVGWIDTGDYLEYDFNVPASGSYKFEFRVASRTNTSKFDFYQDNTKLSNVNKAATGGWQTWVTTSKTVNLEAGSSTLKLLATGGGWNINWIRITPVDVAAVTLSENLALAGEAEQSSDYSGVAGGAELAIDGNTNGKWSSGSVTHTNNSNELDWWQVRLNSNTTIEEVVIWNRTDSCCSSRLSNFDVFIYNSSNTLVFKETYTQVPSPSLTINTGGVSGDRVRVKQKNTATPLSLAEVQIFGTSTGTTTPEGNASIPSDLMDNCNQWKITYPDGEEDKTLCGEANNEYFYVNDEKNGMVFRAPIRSNNGTTPNSDYVRSELRERTEDGGSDIYWTTDGTHVVYVKQAITHLPINKNHLVATQIHGDKDAGIDDAMVLRLEGSNMFLSFNGNKLRSDVTVKSNYSLGTVHEVIFEVINGKHYCYYSEDGDLRSKYLSGNASAYLVQDSGSSVLMDLDYDQSYFKIGNYTQSNADEEGSDTDNSNNYGEVVVYDFFVDHD
ncbi:carbohydrate-binding protein [Cellulophaga baltica]|uniref:carbohydrate-binding protein n=1 Tax=Cellulophaga TaxID=104264 RepID=UPI001C075236|nr:MULTISPECIES: carbohydrate-binding protein [Cellulophaga]MBU2994834.1 carbohydrate-binding protein [Cellulophaga baltica]MDO6766229.1 carbohydrate-binding protein [Cellulophaga sp. 1_MG-2023]